VLHDAIGKGEKCRRVVELDEAGKSGLPGENDRSRVHSEDAERRSSGPGITSPDAPRKRESKSQDSEGDDKRHGEGRRFRGDSQEAGGNDHYGEPARKKQTRRKVIAAHTPKEQAAAEGKQGEHRGKENPSSNESHRCDLVCQTGSSGSSRPAGLAHRDIVDGLNDSSKRRIPRRS